MVGKRSGDVDTMTPATPRTSVIPTSLWNRSTGGVRHAHEEGGRYVRQIMGDRDVFLTIVANAPLVSIDLVVRNPEGKVLVGRRTNEPALGDQSSRGNRE